MFRTLAIIIGLAGLAVTQGQAGLLITPVNDHLTVAAGDVITLRVSIDNGDDADIYLNGTAVNVSGLSFTYSDIFADYLTANFAAVPALGTLNPFDLATVTVSDPLLDDPGDYELTYAFFGGADPFAGDYLGTASFTFTIPTPDTIPDPVGSTVPEPSTWALLGGAAPVLLLIRRCRSSRRCFSSSAASHPATSHPRLTFGG